MKTGIENTPIRRIYLHKLRGANDAKISPYGLAGFY